MLQSCNRHLNHPFKFCLTRLHFSQSQTRLQTQLVFHLEAFRSQLIHLMAKQFNRIGHSLHTTIRCSTLVYHRLHHQRQGHLLADV